MKKLRIILMFLVVITSFQLIQLTGSAQVQKPVAIFYSPHQDDELLSMGMGIINSIAQGYEVHLVLMTDGGGATDALNAVNKKLEKEKFAPLTREDFIKARTEEFQQSAASLGVKMENIHLMNFPDGKLTYNQAKQTIETFEKTYPHAIHKSMSYADWHSDHAVMGKALNDLYNEHKIRDVRFYVKNVQYNTIPGSNEAPKQMTEANLQKIKNASSVYKQWAPASQKYSIGYISVPSNFAGLEKDPQSRTHLANTPNMPAAHKLAKSMASGQADGPISDTNLAATIKTELGVTDRELTEDDLSALTALHAAGKGISSLEGLQLAKNLKFLVLDNNKISDLMPLKGLTQLNELYLKDNQIGNLAPLNELTNLAALNFDFNQVTDLGPISSLTNLQVLTFNNNKVSNLVPLAPLTNLITLSMDSNFFKDITPLKNMTSLNALSFFNVDLDLSKGSGNSGILDRLAPQASVYYSSVKVTRSYHTNRMVGISWRYLDSSIDKVQIRINDNKPVEVNGGTTNYLFVNLNPGQTYNLTISAFSKGNMSFTGDMTVATDAKVIMSKWLAVDRDWYFINPATGNLSTGWLKDNGKWYYLGANGKMNSGWVKVNGKWYYLATSGAMKTGWNLDKGKWYYLDSSGAMRTGWLYVNRNWYYLESSGVMKTGRALIGGKWYYFNASGSMRR
ncbi:leucine-rich repeat domain-containing protein [Neobacillus sp.]|uniref:leucine-rich repeat domain-containing protein n=1 Tax=Neobacillus sp. TaxID=2675273 RepID=UPI002899D586|nr:PIG-L family deacetylase [Neobacillus sp.]